MCVCVCVSVCACVCICVFISGYVNMLEKVFYYYNSDQVSVYVGSLIDTAMKVSYPHT